MKKGITLVAALLLPTQLFAEMITVQGGEHEAYTRLVMVIEPGEAWQIRETSAGIDVTVSSASGFDIDTLQNQNFSRIQAITQADQSNKLRVDFDCQCEVSDYLLSDRFLTIDIKDKASDMPDWPNRETFTRLARPWHTLQTQKVVKSPKSPENSTINDIDTAVSSGIALATYQGFLQIRDKSDSVISQRPQLTSEANELFENAEIGIRALTEVIGNDTSNDGETFPCNEVSNTLVNEWESAFSYRASVSELHQKLAENDMSLDESVKKELAIILLAYGLGAEASALVSDYEGNDPLVATIRFIAYIIDENVSPEVTDLASCENDLSIWSFLHQSDEGDMITANPKTLMMTFKLLPSLLRSRLINKFTTALSLAGYEDYRSELQDFKNTVLIAEFREIDISPDLIKFESSASPQEIIRGYIREDISYPQLLEQNDTTRLSLPILETISIERRNMPDGDIFFEEILALHVRDRNYEMVLDLLSENVRHISSDRHMELSHQYIDTIVKDMTESELVAFAYRSDLPELSKEIKITLLDRFKNINIPIPETFRLDQSTIQNESLRDPAKTLHKVATETESADSILSDLKVGPLPEGTILSFAQSEEILAVSAEIRNTIETFMNNTQK